MPTLRAALLTFTTSQRSNWVFNEFTRVRDKAVEGANDVKEHDRLLSSDDDPPYTASHVGCDFSLFNVLISRACLSALDPTQATDCVMHHDYRLQVLERTPPLTVSV